ncbi:MAG: hypothetical protein ACREFX_01595 [Opitutaceae bacterium]
MPVFHLSTAAAESADPRFLWNEIVRWTFEACILRREGRETRVAEVLRETLPPLIRSWSSRSGRPAESCKRQLRSLFDRAQETVEAGCVQRRLIVEEVCARLAATPQAAAAARPEAAGPLRLRRQVPIGNVVEMIDALAEAEFETFGESILPVRRAITPAPELYAEEPAARPALCA